VLGVARVLFKRQAGFVHPLEDLPGALEEEIAEFGCALIGREFHDDVSSIR
jgi:hypothetical protein